jgi:hypothetical protein
VDISKTNIVYVAILFRVFPCPRFRIWTIIISMKQKNTVTKLDKQKTCLVGKSSSLKLEVIV